MQIIKCEQGKLEWFQHRLGSIGGSSISSVVAKGQGKNPSKTRKSLMCRLIGEILSGVNYEGYSNAHMDRGLDEEPEARNMYVFMNDIEVEKIGLVKETDHKHYSPDGFVNSDGIVEIKSRIPSVHVETILNGGVPPADRKQIQWGLHICQRQWCDYISYSPLIIDKPLFGIHVERDEGLIKELNDGADRFIGEMLNLIKKIKEG